MGIIGSETPPQENSIAEQQGYTMTTEFTPAESTQVQDGVPIQANADGNQASPTDSRVDTGILEDVTKDHLNRLSKDSRRVVFRLTTMGVLFVVGVALAPENVASVVVGYYLLAVYAGWRFLNGFKPASRVIELLSKAVTMVNSLFLPGWASGLMERATTIAMKIGVSIALGVVLAPVEIARSIYELIRLQGLRRDVIEVRS